MRRTNTRCLETIALAILWVFIPVLTSRFSAIIWVCRHLLSMELTRIIVELGSMFQQYAVAHSSETHASNYIDTYIDHSVAISDAMLLLFDWLATTLSRFGSIRFLGVERWRMLLCKNDSQMWIWPFLEYGHLFCSFLRFSMFSCQMDACQSGQTFCVEKHFLHHWEKVVRKPVDEFTLASFQVNQIRIFDVPLVVFMESKVHFCIFEMLWISRRPLL